MYQELSQIKSVKEIERFFLNNKEEVFFTESEIKLVAHKNKIRSLGARYLIKSLILKKFGIENRYKDLEIVNESSGKPFVKFHGKLSEIIKESGIKVQVSISHSRNFITGMVILEEDV